LSKREKLQITRQRAKLEKTLGSIADLTRLPAAMFVVDVMKENIAVKEAVRLNIPVFGIVDTNSDPSNIDFVIPANDDATKSIELIVEVMVKAIEEGIQERKAEQKSEGGSKAKAKKDEPRRKRVAKKEAPKAEKAASEKPAEETEEKSEETK
jgi:small subunit ribosomal protein S2